MHAKTFLKNLLLINLPLSIFAKNDCEEIRKNFTKDELEINSCNNNNNGEVIEL